MQKRKMTTPGVEPGLSRPQRDVLTTRRCGLLAGGVLLQFNAAGRYEIYPEALQAFFHKVLHMKICR